MPISAVDLFCGVGGLTHGLQLSGIPVVAGLDVEHSCQYAYEQNNNARFILRDITQVTGEELNNYFLPNTTKVLVGCAPCQPFSTYSLRYNKNGKKDNKWRLLYYFADLAETVLPEVLSMENVPQLVNEKVFKDFLAQLDDLGYYYSWKIVNCADYGVPQCRRRLVLLASRLGNIELIPPIYDENNYITVRDAILFVFPPVMSCPKTRLILKTPKTATSVRRVWLPKTLAYILREWRDTQQKQKEFLGDEYFDYNLVVAHGNGRPCDCKIIEKSFNRLKEEAGLPNVVFHSLRHSSTTYKLKLNHGDIKATQGDTGHAQADMVTKVYAHILDEDRKVNAQKFESAFYANPDLRDVKPPAEQKTAIDLGVLIEQLKQSPELAQALSGLIVG